MAARVPIRLIVGGIATSLSAAVGEPVGGVIIFANSNPITGLEQIGRVYYEDAPARVVNPRQLISQQDQGKTFVVEANPFPLQNTLAQPLGGAENGIPFEFTIASQKESGGGYPSAVSVATSTGAQVPAELVENGNNFTVKFTPSEDGDFVANVTFTVTATLKVSVASMVPDPVQCVAYGPGLEGGEQYKETYFTIEARNKLGQKIPFGGHPFGSKIKGPFGEDIPVTISDNGDGTYTAKYTPVAPGLHVVEVKLHDTNIKDSPFNVNIDYSSETAHAGNSWADGPGLENGVNKNRQVKPSTFTIHAVDKNGNPKTTGGDLFDVVIEDPLFDIIPNQIKDNNDGTYTVTYQAKEPGVNVVNIFLRNKMKPMLYEHIRDSPRPVDIKSGTDPSKCTAEGPGLHDGIKDTFPAHFKVQARDRDGLPITEGGDDFRPKVTDPDGKDVPCEIKDNGDGTYDVVYHPDKPGPHKIDVTLDDIHIKDMPKTVRVKAGAHHSHTFIENFNFLVQTRDKRGADLHVGGMNVKTTAVNVSSGNSAVPVKQTDKNNGTYLIEYTLPVPTGVTYLFNTTIDDASIKGSPWEQRV